MAEDLARDHTVVVPDLRGLGRSSKPSTGYDKKTQAADVAGVLDALKIDRADLVTHDIGNMVGYAFAIQHPERTARFVLIDAPVPGVGPWEEVLKNPLLWHSVSVDQTWNASSPAASAFILIASGTSFPPPPAASPRPRASTTPGSTLCLAQMHSGFAQFAAFDQDALDNQEFIATKGKLTMPVLAIGREKSFGPMMATIMRFAASNVTEGVVPDSGHWIMEENPKATIAIVSDFLTSN